MNDQFISCVPSRIRVESMRVIRNLIEVKISDDQLNSASFTDGIQIQVRCERSFTVNAFWIVKISDLHKDIERDWKTIRDELWESKFLTESGKSLLQNKAQIFLQSNEEVQCTIKPPKPIDTSTMTVTPRDFYPLVIIVTCQGDSPEQHASDAAANVHIVHIKDNIVPIKTHVIKQYIKQIDGRILDISQLYAEDSAACFICFEEASPDENIQLLCLLPCRHSPICSNCINRIRECPKCRCHIASVFDINAPNAESQPPSRPPVVGSIDPSLRHLYNDNNEDPDATRRQHGFLASIKNMFGF